MRALIYYLALPFLYLLSILPFRLLYLVSDVLYLLVYKLFSYRKQVVTQNLTKSFPGKSSDEIETIRRQFYRYFCDLSVEIIKALTVTPRALEKHFKCDDISIIEKYYKQNQSVIVVMGHLGNWELAAAYFSQLPIHQLCLVYHPLENARFDRLFNRMRTRLGNKTYPMKKAYREMQKSRQLVTATAFIADQSPPPKSAKHWMTFMNQDAGVFKGVEVISKRFDYPVVYLSVLREKRGMYRVACELLIEHPRDLAENELTEIHTKRLEQDIINHPETWLWTHRRWKRKRPEKKPDTQ